MPDGPLLLYDGTCGLCGRTVAFVLRHERSHTVQFAPLDGATAREWLARRPELALVDSVVWVDAPGTPASSVVVRWAAVLRVAAYLGGPWRLARAARIVPRAWGDRLYDLVARHRHHFFDGEAHCLVPPATARGRFLA